jgi:2-haloalkanoic acid dehalogenase type II
VRYDVITFDCYGTLIDWEDGITRAFRAAAAESGRALDDAAVLEAYERIEPAVEAEAYRSYRAVLEECARQVAEQLDFPLPECGPGFLAESVGRWRPFPDTVPALEQLARAGYTLGILSNVDDDLLAKTRILLEVPLSIVVTAEQVRSYKPAPGHFLEARRRIGDRPWLHAARSLFHDIEATRALGIDSAWIRRSGKGSAPADVPTFDDLRALADWLV